MLNEAPRSPRPLHRKFLLLSALLLFAGPTCKDEQATKGTDTGYTLPGLEDCDDGADNDEDGWVDCQDTECYGWSDCKDQDC